MSCRGEIGKRAQDDPITGSQKPKGVSKRALGCCGDESTWTALCLVGMIPTEESGDR